MALISVLVVPKAVWSGFSYWHPDSAASVMVYDPLFELRTHTCFPAVVQDGKVTVQFPVHTTKLLSAVTVMFPVPVDELRSPSKLPVTERLVPVAAPILGVVNVGDESGAFAARSVTRLVT